MTRLSLHDPVQNGQKKLPICRMCCKLFVEGEQANPNLPDQKLAAFSPCGHVFHYNCIMERYDRMEDSCNCVTCFERMDNQPIVLFMEWSKNVRPVSKQETQEIEMITAPDAGTIQLREEVGMLKLKLEATTETKQQLINRLNDISDATAVAKSTCEGLDDQCETIKERIDSFQSAVDREKAICEDLNTRIQRDKNKASLVDLSLMLERTDCSESSVMDFFKSQLGNSSDPDDLLQKLAIFYDSHHRNVKENSRLVAQLKTTVLSVRKDLEQNEKRLHIARRSQVATPTAPAIVTETKKRPRVVDRKTVPMKSANIMAFANDDLGPSRKRSTTSLNFFNYTTHSCAIQSKFFCATLSTDRK